MEATASVHCSETLEGDGPARSPTPARAWARRAALHFQGGRPGQSPADRPGNVTVPETDTGSCSKSSVTPSSPRPSADARQGAARGHRAAGSRLRRAPLPRLGSGAPAPALIGRNTFRPTAAVTGSGAADIISSVVRSAGSCRRSVPGAADSGADPAREGRCLDVACAVEHRARVGPDRSPPEPKTWEASAVPPSGDREVDHGA